MAQETETRTVTRKRVPRKPRVVFTNVRKNVDGTVFVSRGFHGTVYDSGGRLTTGYQTWMKWKERAEKEEQRYQAECEALARTAEEPVRKPQPQPRAVSDADVRAVFERGTLSWRLL